MSEILKNPQEQLAMLLRCHAAQALAKNASNAPYAESVLVAAEQALRLIEEQEGMVVGLIGTWEAEARPIIENLFGDVSELPIGTFKDYSPTVYPGVLARTPIISIDEIFGPMLSLDLMAEADFASPTTEKV